MSNFLLEAGRQTLMLELQEASRLPERRATTSSARRTIIHCEGKLIVSGIGNPVISAKSWRRLSPAPALRPFCPSGGSLHGDLGMLDGRDVMLFISYSGSAKELDLIVPRLEEKGSPAGDDRQIHLAAGAGGESGAGYRRRARSLSDASGADLQHRQHPDARRCAGDGGHAGPRLQ